MTPTKVSTRIWEAFLLFSIAICAALLAQQSLSFEQGPNNRNVSVDTRVNITGSLPEVLQVIIDPSPITLTAGTTTLVLCNATVRDFNGFGDLRNATAQFFSIGSSSYDAADDNNTHYTNDTCAQTGTDGNFANYSCGFRVSYYAINDTWNCTFRINDTIGLSGNNSNLSNILQVLALNVTTLIDYGDLAMGDTSSLEEANVSNEGNTPINISVLGYGATFGDGLSFNCTQGNLTVDLQHFANNNTAAYSEMQVLSSSRQNIARMVVPKTQDNAGRYNETYWQLFLDPAQNAFGECNGTIVFQAEA